MCSVQQIQLEGIPQPSAVRKGRRGRHPKPDALKPERMLRVKAYRRDNEALQVLKDANPGETESAIVRRIIQERADELRAARAAAAKTGAKAATTATQESLPV